MTYDVVRPFDPWRSTLCTCPTKYSFNPYTGCAHGCLYCYATYIPHFHRLRLKKNLMKHLERDLRKLPENQLISMSNSSDPYPPLERERMVTRGCLELMRERDVRLLIVTKSDIAARDIDLLSRMRCAVSITITSTSKNPLEPYAPSPEERMTALRELHHAGIPTILRLDPIFPFLSENDALEVVEQCDFVDHVVTSTLKLRGDSFKKIVSAYPQLERSYRELYFKKGEKIHNSWYLPVEVRENMLGRVKDKCRELGVSCAFCREGLEFNAGSCDGSHLI
ncbi:MAG: radical SAM protein [Archaeoglobaceae archaeon]